MRRCRRYVGRVLLCHPNAAAALGAPARSGIARRVRRTGAALLFILSAVTASAQTPAPPAIERVTFEEAIQRALANNPTIAGAAEAVLRAEGLLQQARAATRPGVNAFVTNATLDTGRSFNGVVIQPRNQTAISAH